MGARELGRKATVFMERTQVLKAEWFYRPVFSRSKKLLVISAASRRQYWQFKFEDLQASIRLDAFTGKVSRKYLGGV